MFNVDKITTRSKIVLKVFGEVLFLYGFLGWLYGILINFLFPQWLPLPLSHLTLWIRTDTFTIALFFVSAIGFFIWQITRELQK